MAQAHACKVLDVSRICFRAGQNELGGSSTTPPRPAFSGLVRKGSMLSSPIRITQSPCNLRKATGVASAADYCSCKALPSVSSSVSENVESNPQRLASSVPTRRTAVLLAGAALFSTLVANESPAHAAANKPPIVEEVPEFVKGEF